MAASSGEASAHSATRLVGQHAQLHQLSPALFKALIQEARSPGTQPGESLGHAEFQNSLVRYIRASVSGDQQAASAARDDAVNGLARVANISPEEARNRVNQAEQQYRQTVEQAKLQATRATEVARRNTSRAGIFGFIALVLGAIAAWFGGGIGTPRQAIALVRP